MYNHDKDKRRERPDDKGKWEKRSGLLLTGSVARFGGATALLKIWLKILRAAKL